MGLKLGHAKFKGNIFKLKLNRRKELKIMENWPYLVNGEK